MNIEWQSLKSPKIKHSNRWGHASCSLPGNDLVLYGGYADSKFFNDVWVYKPIKNSWLQVQFKDNQKQPCPRSNSSFFYSFIHKSIIMFGGGSSQNSRHNDLWNLEINQNIQTNRFEGQWNQLFPECEKIPWGRTYHVSEIYQNYLLIHGGQAYTGDIEDLWALNLKDLSWIQLKGKNIHQARKFHSSAIIRNRLYILGGIFGSYQTLNKIQFVDLSVLKSSSLQLIEDHNFQWVQVQNKFNQFSIISRWGHVSRAYQDKIYIFGGRSFVQQNDLLIFDPKRKSIKKVNSSKSPQGRRKPCTWLIGSYLIINSGYNGKYLCDQFYINLRFAQDDSLERNLALKQINHKKQGCDIHINTIDNKYIDLNTKFIKTSFQSEDDMIMFLQELAQMKYQIAVKYVNILNNGVYINENETKNNQEICLSSQNISSSNNFTQIDESLLKKYKITYSTSELLGNKKKILFNVIKEKFVMNLNPLKPIKVSKNQFNRIFKQIQTDFCCDLKIQTFQNHSKGTPAKANTINCCRYPLMIRSQYFQNMLQNVEKALRAEGINNLRGNYYELKIEVFQSILIKIIVLYCYYGHVVVPKQFTLFHYFQLFKLSKKCAIKEVMSICFEQMKELISSKQMEIWIQQKISSASAYKINEKTNPEKLQTEKSLRKGIQTFLAQQQFQEILNFTLNQSKQISQCNKVNGIRQKNQTIWSQILAFLIHQIFVISIKNITSKRRDRKMQNSVDYKKLIESGKISKKSYKIENKQNINKRQKKQQYIIKLTDEKRLSNQALNSQQNLPNKLMKKPINSKKSNYLDIIIALINFKVINFLSSNKMSEMSLNSSKNIFLEVEILKKQSNSRKKIQALQNAIDRQHYLGQFKFNVLSCEFKA